MNRAALLLISFAIPLFAETDFAPGEFVFGETCEHPMIPSLNGILLLGKNVKLLKKEEALKQVAGVKTLGVDVPGGTEKLAASLSPYFGKPLCDEDVLGLIEAIRGYYQDQMRPFVSIEMPKQEATCVLQFVVAESQLGKVCVEGNKASHLNRVLSRVELCPGDLIDEKVLLRDMQFLNRNPFRRVDLIYSPGEKPYTTDVMLRMEERSPYRFYAGGDNTGVGLTGQMRWFAGVNLSFTGWADHNLSYQYTTSNDFHDFQAHTLQYLVMLPSRHLLNFYGGYSSVHGRFSVPGMTNHGSSYQVSGRYIYLLNPTRRLNHEFSAGWDFKETNNALNFGEEIAVSQPVNLFQLAAKYAGNFEGSRYRLDYSLEGYWSPGEWLPDQTNGDYQAIRPGAKNHWVYGRGALTYSQKLPHDFWFFSMFRGQFTGENLLPSEQLGIGGYDTVRGYKERELNKDKGAIANIEFRSPALKVFSRGSQTAKLVDALQFIAFFDVGYGSNHEPLPGEPRGEYLIGTGPGARYTLGQTLTGRLDWGVKLHHREPYGGGWSMLHFSLIASY